MKEREIRQRVSAFLIANKEKDFSLAEIRIGATIPDTTDGIEASLTAVIRCPYTACQSFDTGLLEDMGGGSERHHCSGCDRNFHVQRDADGRWAILGWYGE
jgi:hypothetical protein